MARPLLLSLALLLAGCSGPQEGEVYEDVLAMPSPGEARPRCAVTSADPAFVTLDCVVSAGGRVKTVSVAVERFDSRFKRVTE
jgi:hypothetical protein